MAKDGAENKVEYKEYSTFLNTRVPVALARRIDRAAGERGESRSDYVRREMERAVARFERRQAV
jgi:predicted HicB family RNase H-like nuclease